MASSIESDSGSRAETRETIPEKVDRRGGYATGFFASFVKAGTILVAAVAMLNGSLGFSDSSVADSGYWGGGFNDTGDWDTGYFGLGGDTAWNGWCVEDDNERGYNCTRGNEWGKIAETENRSQGLSCSASATDAWHSPALMALVLLTVGVAMVRRNTEGGD